MKKHPMLFDTTKHRGILPSYIEEGIKSMKNSRWKEFWTVTKSRCSDPKEPGF